ncbi:CG0192-related protein [Nocardioides insulae]|uniref:CG0192-related protein n=1 Tax=Nocardioides insulae TaxID=394734 RepID=UPI00042A00ED|nr:hypothetical protein [Nocardioides insulae]
MAIIYPATISPTKAELLDQWVPTQSWWPGDDDVQEIASYRFDDPDGQVGIETFLLRAGDESVVQVPMTYRGTPAPDPSAALICTMEHSVLGTRWIYDAPTDPTYLEVVRQVILEGGREVALEIHHPDGSVTTRPTTCTVTGRPGTASDTPVDPVLALERRPSAGAIPTGPVLVGTWEGQTEPVVLARLI